MFLSGDLGCTSCSLAGEEYDCVIELPGFFESTGDCANTTVEGRDPERMKVIQSLQIAPDAEPHLTSLPEFSQNH